MRFYSHLSGDERDQIAILRGSPSPTTPPASPLACQALASTREDLVITGPAAGHPLRQRRPLRQPQRPLKPLNSTYSNKLTIVFLI
jgi:hypothetical protein